MPVSVQTNEQVQALIDEFRILGGFRLQLDEVVVPVAIVSELAAGEIGEGAIGGDRLSGVNRQTFSVHNPTGSPILVACNRVTLAVQAAASILWGIGGTILVNAVTESFKDLRLNATSVPNGNVRQEDLAAIPVGGNQLNVTGLNANEPYVIVFDPPFIIPQNQQLWFQNGTNGASLSAIFEWREVPDTS